MVAGAAGAVSSLLGRPPELDFYQCPNNPEHRNKSIRNDTSIILEGKKRDLPGVT
jgi:hypothetical protein